MGDTQRIPVSGPSITEREIRYVTDAVTNAWFGNANVFNERFERAFAAHLGVRAAVTLPSCTSGIHLALAGLGIGPGDEVIVPDCTWIASAAPITYVGATTVFADIDPQTWCLSPESFRACITPRTRAVIPVDLYGNVADYDTLIGIAREHGVEVVEDAAEAVGATYHGKPAGSFGRAAVFSFHGSKTLTTGEGGMLATDDEPLLARVQQLRDHGRKPGDKNFYNVEVGFKYKMSSMQAALGLAQLERLPELVAQKRRIFEWYCEALEGVTGLSLNAEPQGATSTFWMVTVVLDPKLGITKSVLAARLDARGIDTRPFFHPLSTLPAYEATHEAAAGRERNRVAHAIAPFALNLPSGLQLTRADVQRVASAVRSAVS